MRLPQPRGAARPIALSYRTPSTLRASLRSWARAGLLRLVSERLMLLNDPLPIDVQLSLDHGFEVLTPDELETVRPARTAKKNVLTIGSAFYHGLVRATSDYVLFLEKDFVADTALSERAWREQLLTAITLLDQGAAVVRLRSRKDQGCGTFRMCKDDANKPNWQGASTMARRRNWWSFYCADWKKPGAGVVADCAAGSAPLFRCFTSWDSNWSLNAVMVHREVRVRRA